MEENNQEEDKGKKKSKKALIISIIILIILLLLLVVSIYVVRLRTQTTGKAYGPTDSTQTIELANSYMFASPLRAKADGQERIRLTVFILDSQGKGVGGKEVNLGNQVAISVDSIQPTTDEVGKAIFDITSASPGLFIIEASVEGNTLPQRVNINFE